MPSIDTLIEDIQHLFVKEGGHTPSDENLEFLAESLKCNVLRALQERRDARHNEGKLRLSGVGQPERKVWYKAKGYKGKPFDGRMMMLFMMGNIYEDLLLFLAKEAGHKVEHEQEKVEVDGVPGHLDCVIDDVMVDVKTASSYGFKKFKDNTIAQDDSFGYGVQINSYKKAMGSKKAMFWAIEKGSQDMTLCPAEEIDVSPIIAKHKENLKSDTPPPRCYDIVPDGASGNMALHKLCGFCEHRQHCWTDDKGEKVYRTFKYADGTLKHLTTVAKAPRVEEVEDE